jgi:hypothetical protein
MTQERLPLQGFAVDKIQPDQTQPLTKDEGIVLPRRFRHPVIDQVLQLVLDYDEEVLEFGFSLWAGDDEERVFAAFLSNEVSDTESDQGVERMLISKYKVKKSGGWKFIPKQGLIIEAQYAGLSEELRSLYCGQLDLSHSNQVEENSDWITMMYDWNIEDTRMRELYSLKELTLEEVEAKSKRWWNLSPIDMSKL